MSVEPVPDPAGELDAVAAELRRVLALADPVPDEWRGDAGAAFDWVGVDAAVAHLTYDSRALQGGRVGTGLGTAATLRTLRFSVLQLTVELELDVGVDELRVFGRLRPARAAEIVVRWPDGQVATTSDCEGTFRLDELPRRPLCLHVAGDPAVKTGWIVV
ncbi:MAG TPA: hypothetical protein VFY82_00080 [Acidimicrobiales bacterium]|nr:hypothetical protein [Acidimicrobiales bacterium]